MSEVDDILRQLKTTEQAFDRSADALALHLRLDLSALVLEALEGLGWTQAALARATGIGPPKISAIVHADANCQIDTIARLLHALKIKARLVQASRVTPLRLSISSTLREGINVQAQSTNVTGGPYAFASRASTDDSSAKFLTGATAG